MLWWTIFSPFNSFGDNSAWTKMMNQPTSQNGIQRHSEPSKKYISAVA